LRFCKLSWYKEGHTQVLTEAWDQIIEDALNDLDKEEELDETELERELLEDFEIQLLHEWRLLHPKASMVGGEASGSSPALDIGTSSSIPAAATT